VPSTGNCPDGELLLAFLTAAVDSETARRLDAHLDACDACLEALVTAQNRLARSSEMTEKVPPSLSERLAAVPPQRAATPAGDRHVAYPANRRVRRLPVSPILRFAGPLALAASLLLVVASQTSWFSATPQRQTRSVPMSQHLKVTAREVQVRAQPHLQAEVVAKLTRGDVVEVGGEDREWYRVALPGGGEGWVEQYAFR
jgi:hypothetical protein